MKIFTILAVCVAPLMAGVPSSSVVITDNGGAPQTNRTVVLHRYFAQGEILNYPRPMISGQTVATWQSDVKTRHRDGQATCSITGATNTYPLTITCVDHGFRTGEWVVISGVEGNTAANGRWRIIRINKDSFLIRTTGNGAYTSGGAAAGPGPGSVASVMMALVIPSISANGAVTVSFVNSSNPCSSGNSTACAAAGLDASGMLGMLGGEWDAKIKATQGSTVSVSARTMLTDENFTYWMRGPAATVVVAEDASASRSYDFGYNCLSNCTGDYSTATWESDSTNKPLHPVFVLWFAPADGTPKIKYDYQLQNSWTTALKDQRYDLDFTKGTGDTSVFAATVTHYAMQWFTKVGETVSGWSSVPPAITIDLGRDYMVYSRLLPSYEIGVDVPAAAITSEWSAGNALDYSLNPSGDYFGYYAKNLYLSGAHPYIGWVERHSARYLFTFDSQLLDLVIRNAQLAGIVPRHLRESATGKYFIDYDRDGAASGDAGDNITGNAALGRFVSVDARPLFNSTNWDLGGDDKIVPIETLSSTHGFTNTYEVAHMAAQGVAAYIATGNPLFLAELQQWGASSSWVGNADYNILGRHGAWGIVNQVHAARGLAWGLRQEAQAFVLTPDSDMEKVYFEEKTDNLLAALEGMSYLTSGAYFWPMTGGTETDPCPSGSYSVSSYLATANTPWCFGWRTLTNYIDGGSGFDFRYGNHLGYITYGDGYQSVDPMADADKVSIVESPWMMNFFHVTIGWMREWGFPVDALWHSVGRFPIGSVVAEDKNPWTATSYRVPSMDKTSPIVRPFQTWTAFYDAVTADCKAKAAYDDGKCWMDSYQYTLAEEGYGTLLQSALAYFVDISDGPRRGQDAYDYILLNWPNGHNWLGPDGYFSPMWAMRPRKDPTRVLKVEPGATQAVLDYVAPTASACTVVVDNDSDFESPVVNASDNGSARNRQYIATGLTAGTLYYYRLACADDPYTSGNTDGSFTTLAAQAGTSSFTIRLAAPTGLTHAKVEYGATAGLGTSTSDTVCSSGCSITISVAKRTPFYYRWIYSTGGQAVLTSHIQIATIN